MSTFIERFGYVKYKSGLYQARGPCEIPGCRSDIKRLMFDYKFNLYLYQLACDAGRQRYVSPMYYREPMYVVDHCHEHHFIRGVICQSCNNQMAWVDNGQYLTDYYLQPNVFIDAFMAQFNPQLHVFCHEPQSAKIAHILRLYQYRSNCPECAGLTNYTVSKIPVSERKQQMSQCPNCLGDQIEPRPVCLYYNNERPPCEINGDKPPCSQCGPEKDEPCSYCNGTGRAKRLVQNCSSCGKYTTIYWLPENWCRECYESMEDAYSEEDPWEMFPCTPDGPVPVVMAEELAKIGVHFDPYEIYGVERH